MDIDLRSVVPGFVGVALVLGVLFWFAGPDSIRASLSRLDPRSVLLVCGLGTGWLVAWGLALRQVLAALDVRTSVPRAVLLYAGAEFANNVTPFGQAGGEPFSAYLISHTTGAPYETSLAAIASVDTLNFVPSIVFAVLGVGYYLTAFAAGGRVRTAAFAVVALAVLAPTLGYALWSTRDRLADRAAVGVTALLGRLSAVSERVPALSHETVRERIAGFFEGIERVAADRRALGTALLCSALGWLCLCATLYVSLRALAPDTPVPALVVFVVVPVATTASALPLPGGEGGVEAVVVLLLVPIVGVPVALATSVAVVYRIGTYWLATLVGGGATVALRS